MRKGNKKVKEQRSFRRLLSAIDVTYTKARGYVTINSSSICKDISFGGLSMPISSLVKKGDDLLLELRSSYKNKTMAALARVAWVKRVSNDNYNICGVEFLWFSSKSVLFDYLEFAAFKKVA